MLGQFATSGSLQPGDVIAERYRIDAVIEEGAFASVYRVSDLELERRVAIKVLYKKSGVDPVDRARFRLEARLLSKLSHDAIVNVHDYGETPGFYYLVMDFIAGANLEKLLAQVHRLPPQTCLSILIQVCNGLEYVHSKGVLHRDIKPKNIMLNVKQDEPPKVVLVDFGIAKPIHGSSLQSLELTAAGDTVGSPSYMSPEQCRGEQLDCKTDIYSLACVAYQALTGVIPFRAGNTLAVFVKHATEMPPPFAMACPSARIDENFERVIFKALAKDRNHRHASMAELKRELVAIAAAR